LPSATIRFTDITECGQVISKYYEWPGVCNTRFSFLPQNPHTSYFARSFLRSIEIWILIFLEGKAVWASAGIYLVVGNTFDGPMYANVGPDLVRSSSLILTRIGRATRVCI
jgi:hypothetical protein